MVGAQGSYLVSWSCRTLGLTIGALIIIYQCGATYASPLQLRAAPTLSPAYEDERASEDAHVLISAEITQKFTSSRVPASQPTKRLSNSAQKRRLNGSYILPPASLHELRGARGRGSREHVYGQQIQTVSVEQAGSLSRRLEEESNIEENPLVLPGAEPLSSEKEENPNLEKTSNLEMGQDRANSSVGTEQGKQKKKRREKADASGTEDGTKHAEQAGDPTEASGSAPSAGEGPPAGAATGGQRLSRKEDNADAEQRRDKQTRGPRAPPLDPTAPIEELLDPAKIDRGSLVKTLFSKLTVKHVLKDKPPPHEPKKRENDVYQEAQEVYTQAKEVPAKFEKNVDIAEAKVSPPKQLSWYTRFMEGSEKFFARWGKPSGGT